MLRRDNSGYWAAGAILVGMAALLLWMGRELICPCGYVKLWHGQAGGPESSQHISDWYTPSHIIHGLLFFALFWLLARQVPLGWRLAAASLIEALWEMLENTDRVIEHYRSVTISFDYDGDSVLNSVCDMLAMWLGFWLARVLPVWASVALAIGFELFTTWMIRDGLALNVLMFVWPFEAVKDWQGAL